MSSQGIGNYLVFSPIGENGFRESQSFSYLSLGDRRHDAKLYFRLVLDRDLPLN